MNPPLGISGRVAAFFLHSPLTPLIAVTALLLGLFAVWVTPKEEEPQINVTMANVFIPFPGAAVRDVEALVATPAEQVLSQINGIDHVYSVSRPGLAIMTVQFKVGVSRTEAVVRLHDSIAANRDWVSPYLGVGEPIIKPKGIEDVPIVTLTLTTADAQRAAFDLQQVAHAMEIELKALPGTREVYTLGGPDHVVRVQLSPERMNAHHIAAGDIRDALQLANASLPSGRLVDHGRELLVQTGSFLAGAADVRQLVVGVSDGKPVLLSDVATVSDGPDQPSRYVWSGPGAAGKPGAEQPAVTLAVSKKAGENAAGVAAAVLQRVEQLKGQVIPSGVDVAITRNYGATAADKAAKLMQKLLFATLSVVVLAWLALGRREAVIVGAAVLLTLAGTLFASWAWGFTLNRVSLFALIFSIGILVDDAIVVVENIHRRQALDSLPLADIIPRAVDEVGSPTILATLTVIAALLPMAFVSGLMGPYMSPIPINSSLGMLISLAIAFIVTPWLALKVTKAHAAPTPSSVPADRLGRWFSQLLTPFLAGRRGQINRRWLALGVVLAIVGSVGLAGVQWVVLKMLPFDNKSEFQVVVDLPTGTPLEATAAVLHELAAEIALVPEVESYQAYAGTAAPINFNGLVRQYYLRSGPEVGDLQVNLQDKQQRRRKSHDIAQSVLPKLEAIGRRHQARVKVVEVPPGPPVLAPLVAEIYGPDYAGQMAVAKAVRAVFGATAHIVGIDDSVDDPAPRIVLTVLQSKAALLGVAPKDVVTTMRLGLSGEDVTPILGGQAKYQRPVRLELPAERQSGLDQLLKLTVRARDGNRVPLSELVQASPTQREATIHHKDLQPVVYVLADSGGKLDSPLYGMFDIRRNIAGMALPQGGVLGDYLFSRPTDRYAGYAVKWDGEWQITYETFRDMGLAYGVGLVLIYLLVVAQFKSYVTPLIIMAPIPLTVIGVMPGHALLGAQYTAASMIGMIALAGIIVRNSILLVDFIHLQRAAGHSLEQAVVDAAGTRAKPILLTGLAAMMGALFILDDPIFSGLAVSLLFGIAVSTLLTLVVIPVLVYVVEQKE